jgi:hypothetical protein
MFDHSLSGECMAGRRRQWIYAGFIASTSGFAPRTVFKPAGSLAGVALLTLMVLLCWSSSGCTVTGAGADARPLGFETLNGRFRNLAYEQLSFKLERSSPLSPPARQAIETFIADGARRLSTDGATAERIAAAEVNLNRFVSQLSEAADVGERGDINPETVAATRNRLCPLYPFC